MLQLCRLQELAGIREATTNSSNIPQDDPIIEDEYEENDNTAAPSGPSVGSTAMPPADSVPVELQILFLPSNGNVQGEWAHVELPFRKQQAEAQLNRLRDLIADKSFQYSHIMRQAPRKGVRTRSRAAIHELNMQIALHARIYGRCHSRLASLGADETMTNAFQILTRDDLKASTAMLKPNLPGSTQLKLSWIWQSAGRIAGHIGFRQEVDGTGTAESDAATMLECEYLSI